MNFNPTPTDRVNKYISNNIRLTYKCHTLLETSGQGLPIYQHIVLILGGYLTLHTYMVNRLMMDIVSNQTEPTLNLDLDETFTWPSDGHCFKPDHIKLYQTNSNY